jgi:hypothetical protein
MINMQARLSATAVKFCDSAHASAYSWLANALKRAKEAVFERSSDIMFVKTKRWVFPLAIMLVTGM